MALEDKIEALTAALTRNSDILEAGLKRSQAAAAGAATKPAGTTAAPKAAAPKAAPKKAAAPTEDDIRTHFGTYLGTKDKDVKEERKGHVRAILDHIGVNLASEIPEDRRQEAIDFVKQLTAGETPDFMSEEPEADAGEGLI